MKANVAGIDKWIRIILAVVLIGLYVGDVIPGAEGVVLTVTAAVLLLTTLVDFCAVGRFFGISNKKTQNQQEESLS